MHFAKPRENNNSNIQPEKDDGKLKEVGTRTVCISGSRKNEYLEEPGGQHGPNDNSEAHSLVYLKTGTAGREPAPSVRDVEGLRLNAEAVGGEHEHFLVEDAIAVDFFQ